MCLLAVMTIDLHPWGQNTFRHGQSLFLSICQKPTGDYFPIARTSHRGCRYAFLGLWPLTYFLAPAVIVGETEGAMDSTSVFFLPLLLPITL